MREQGAIVCEIQIETHSFSRVKDKGKLAFSKTQASKISL